MLFVHLEVIFRNFLKLSVEYGKTNENREKIKKCTTQQFLEKSISFFKIIQTMCFAVQNFSFITIIYIYINNS